MCTMRIAVPSSPNQLPNELLKDQATRDASFIDLDTFASCRLVSNPFYAEQSSASGISGTKTRSPFPSRFMPPIAWTDAKGHQLAPNLDHIRGN